METPWRIEAFGGLTARRGDHVITRFASSRIGGLLARLALFPQRAHPREELIDLLWPDADLDAGRLNLRVALASLRRQLEPPDVPPGSVLIADRAVVRLHPAAGLCDVVEFEAALKAAGRAPDVGKKRDALDQALALYAGELMPGFWDEWVLDERGRLEALRDEAARERQALPSSASQDAPFPAIPEAAPAGRPSLRGFPIQFTRFFGRDEECAQAAAWLGEPGTRLVTLSGPGGTGKSRLAAQIAQRTAAGYGGPVCFVPLADLNRASLIPGAVAQALGLTRSGEMEPLDQVVSALAAQPPALLILDNYEHLVDEGAAFVFSLLSRLPALSCLVTSRRRLGLPGEREFPVPPLPVPDAGGTLEEIAPSAGVRLFVDRAQAARPDFQITRGNAGAVADLCRTLEGLPLAIELVAARAQSLTLTQMAERLTRRFELLSSRRGDKSGRHRSLWAAIAWSYDLLPTDLQAFWAQLSVFRGGCTAESATSVCRESRAGEFLPQLRERSLVVMAEENGVLRFRLPESLREFGAERLSAEERRALGRRHVDFFTDLAGRMGALWSGPQQRAALEALDAEADNLRAALDFCRTDAPDTDWDPSETGLRLGASLGNYWTIRGLLREGLGWLEGLLEGGGSEGAKAKALAESGWLAAGISEYGRAEAALGEAITLSRRLGDRTTLADALRKRGVTALWQEDNEPASTYLEEALTVARAVGDDAMVANALNSLGVLANQWHGGKARAHVLYEEALALFRKCGDRQKASYCLHNLGNLALDFGDSGRAEALLRESLALADAMGDEWHRAYCLRSLGDVLAARGDLAGAAPLLEEGRDLCRRLGDRMTEAGTVRSLAALARLQGASARAVALSREALALHRDTGNAHGVALCLLEMAEIAGEEGRWERAAGLAGCKDAACGGVAFEDETRTRFASLEGAAREALGAEGYEAARSRGGGPTLEECAAYALHD